EDRTEAAVTYALAGVDLDVAAGEYVAVMGPSGSGKSTLLHIMGGLDKPTSGAVYIGGRDIATLSDRRLTRMRRRELGFVFQFFNLVPVLTARENVALPLVVDGVPKRRYRRRVDELLGTVGLADRADHLPAQLSGGQQQRVAIARALVAAPDVLLADEPTGNLDSRSGADVLGLLRRLVDEHGQTVVIITHDPRAASGCDRIVFIRDGLIVDELVLAGTGGDRAKSVFAWLQALEAS
ncbi:MAG: ABC transporter ATP-binding protein, partial [Acidimicrobiia bacterium]|nr:ABC transporter ATP-binding protein [Acidimicrobiia bacterium]